MQKKNKGKTIIATGFNKKEKQAANNEMNKNNLFLSDDNEMFFYEFVKLKENTVYNFYVILSNIFGKCQSSSKVEVNLGRIKKKTSFGISDFNLLLLPAANNIRKKLIFLNLPYICLKC